MTDPVDPDRPSYAPSAHAGDVTVTTTGGVLRGARDQALDECVRDGLPHALVSKDATLWGPAATAEASVRLGWLDVTRVSRPLVGRILALRDELRAEGVDRVVLAGMGGSSLAPEVITRTAGVELTVLDTTDPGQVRAAMVDLGRTVVVVSSKSGGTVETDSHRRAFEQAFLDAGVDAPRRIVVVTDPGSPLEAASLEAGYREVFLADPNVGGRYSALTAFGLVPSGLAGVDIGRLLDEAAEVEPALGWLSENPGLWLGAALGGGANSGHDKLVIAAESSSSGGSGIVGFGDWAEQLIAESTGKGGKGVLPVVVEGPDAPGFSPAADIHLVTLTAGPHPADATAEGTWVSGPLGAQFLVWEFATAVAGRVIGIDPFDQPNVQESKDNTKTVLEQAGDGPLPEGEPVLVDGPISVYAGDSDLLDGVKDVAGAIDALLRSLPDHGYVAVMAYLDRLADVDAEQLRPALARRTGGRPVTFGWGPRFLHSTGQYHKGGPQVGVYLQVTGAVTDDLDVPGRPYSFGRLQLAQALGDLRALESRARPAVRLHLTDRQAGLRMLLDAAGQ